MRSLLKSIFAVAGLVALLPAEALAAPVALCAGQTVTPDVDGRVFHHLPYADALSIDLVDDLTQALRSTSAAVVVATHDRRMQDDLHDWPRLDL